MSRLLIVDDNKDIAAMMKEMTEALGHEACTAYTGKECLSTLRQDKFDLVLLDIAMPEMTGIDVLKEIKKDSELQHTKVVFFTASSLVDEDIEKLKKLGAFGCIKKPIKPTALSTLLENL